MCRREVSKSLKVCVGGGYGTDGLRAPRALGEGLLAKVVNEGETWLEEPKVAEAVAQDVNIVLPQ